MAKIVVVDDDKQTRESLSRALTAAGHECICLDSGRNVVDMLRRENPSVLLLDIMLPGNSGFEVCREIRRDPELYMLPILMISAMNSEEEVAHGLAQGADDYLGKPFDQKNLISRIDMLLRTTATATDSDSLTNLPGADLTKREVQRRLSSRDTFALGCVELVGIREYGRTFGADARNKVIRHLGRALRACGERTGNEGFYVGHMGGGHFVCILGPREVQSFCSAVQKLWADHVEKLREQIGEQNYQPKPDEQPLSGPDVLICVTMTDPKATTSPQHLFEILAQLRHKALETRKGGIYIDRRVETR